MTYALALDSRQIAVDLHGLLKEIDTGHWKAEFADSCRERFAMLQERVDLLLAGAAEADADLVQRLEEVAALLRDHMPSYSSPSPAEIRREWMRFRRQLVEAYSGLSSDLEAWSVHVPSLRPKNYARNLFHLANGLTALIFIEWVLQPTGLIIMAAALAATAWSLESARRLLPALNRFLVRLFGPVIHPHERHRVNSATWYATALLVLALTSPPMVCALAVTILALGDPAAAIVGRRWGRIALINGRSLEGSATFFLVAAIASWLLMAAFYGDLAGTTRLAVALAAALAAALAELVSRRVDDNFSVPLTAALGAGLALHLLT
jgi:dolichol kinase